MLAKYFGSRSGIAAYLGITRMTLNRWEKKVPLVNGTLRGSAFHIDKSDVDVWYDKLRKIFRPYNAWQKDRSLNRV